MDRPSRQRLVRTATETRLRSLREAVPVEVIRDKIVDAAPEMSALEAWRHANGWTRSEVSARLDALYEADGLAPPSITDAEICRWEHGQRRPSDERVEYLCRLYGTRPDRLGFGVDYSDSDIGHLQTAGISHIWPRTNDASYEDLISRTRDATTHVTLFGLTRNFYAQEEFLPLFEAKAVEIPVTFFAMDPWCASRRDRYRLEPAEAAMEDPKRWIREVLRPLWEAKQRVAPAAGPGAGIQLYLYNFPVSFAVEHIDTACRVMLYGHGARGTDSPILVFEDGTPYYEYFVSQIRWLHQLATRPRQPWTTKGLVVRPVEPPDVS